MTEHPRRGDAARTCWSCEGSGQRLVGSNGRLHKQPCAACAGVGTQSDMPRETGSLDWRPDWLKTLSALF